MRHVGGTVACAGLLALLGGSQSSAIPTVPAPSITGLTVTGVPRVVQLGNTAPQPISAGADVDGDGNDDAIIGSPLEAARGRREAGAGYVVSGRPGRRSVDVRRLGGEGFRLDGAPPTLPVELDDQGPAGEQSGTAVAGLGDVNGDGLDDVAVGAPYSSAGGRPLAGAVHVAFGRKGASGVDLGQQGDAGYRIDGADNSALLGSHVAAAGDTNGDGLHDVVVASKRGVWIAFGQRGSTAVDLGSSGSNSVAIRPEPGKTNEDDTPTRFPVAGAGDVNGDGLADVVVGVPDLTPRNRFRSGAAYVVFGRRQPGQVRLDQLAGGGFRIDGEDSGSTGSAVAAAGDVNGDRLGDVLVGAPELGGDTSDETNDYGAAYVVLGARTPKRVDLARRRGAAWRIVGDELEADGEVGSGLAALGDVNGDGLGDLAVGAPGWDGDCRRDSGAVFVVRGRRAPASLRLGGSPRGVYRLDGGSIGAGLGRSLAPVFRTGFPGAAVLSSQQPASDKRPAAPPRVLDTRLPRRTRAAVPPSRCVRTALLSRSRSRILRTRTLRVRLTVARPRARAAFQLQVYGVFGRRDDLALLAVQEGRLRGSRVDVRLRLTRGGRRLLASRRAIRVVTLAYLDTGDDGARRAFSQDRLRR